MGVNNGQLYSHTAFTLGQQLPVPLAIRDGGPKDKSE
jgi:hypothetical protein